MNTSWKLALLACALPLTVCMAGVAAADSLLDPVACNLLAPRAMRVGDLVTIVVSDIVTTTQAVNNKSDTSNTLNTEGGSGLFSVFPGAGWGAQGNAQRKESAQTVSSFQNTITSRVVEVLPGGVVVVEAESSVRMDGKKRHMLFRGKVRRADIGPSNIVTSDKFADMNLAVDGNLMSPNGGGGLLHFLLFPFR